MPGNQNWFSLSNIAIILLFIQYSIIIYPCIDTFNENIKTVNGDAVANNTENQESIHTEEPEHTYEKYFATVDRLAILGEDLGSHCIYKQHYNSYFLLARHAWLYGI